MRGERKRADGSLEKAAQTAGSTTRGSIRAEALMNVLEERNAKVGFRNQTSSSGLSTCSEKIRDSTQFRKDCEVFGQNYGLERTTKAPRERNTERARC